MPARAVSLRSPGLHAALSARVYACLQGDPVGSPITPGANKPLNVVRWTGTQWVAVGGFAGAGTNSQYIALTFEPINSIVSCPVHGQQQQLLLLPAAG